MRLESIFYRSRQFFQALYAVPRPEDLSLASNVLSTHQMDLFTRMQRSEQAHSLLVFKRLYSQCQQEPVESQGDLLAAALLHDVGKSCYPLSLCERVLIVLAKVILPGRIEEWGDSPVSQYNQLSRGSSGWQEFGWKRAFVIAKQHPVWGAELAAKAGCSPVTTSLIRRHQEVLAQPALTTEDRLLLRLQSADGSY